MSLLETATRARTRRRMGMQQLYRLIMMMDHFIHRLGNTADVSLYRSLCESRILAGYP